MCQLSLHYATCLASVTMLPLLAHRAMASHEFNGQFFASVLMNSKVIPQLAYTVDFKMNIQRFHELMHRHQVLCSRISL